MLDYLGEIDRGTACHETDCVLRRFRPDRRDYRLFHRSICGTLVGTCELAGVPRLFFHCFLGRMAARNPRHLIFSFSSLLFGTAATASGFPSFEMPQRRTE